MKMLQLSTADLVRLLTMQGNNFQICNDDVDDYYDDDDETDDD